jgi:hypothetical protein
VDSERDKNACDHNHGDDGDDHEGTRVRFIRMYRHETQGSEELTGI